METNALRVFVEVVDREMSKLVDPADSAQSTRTGALRASWARLVGFMALGPAPELRDCPKCGHSGMRAATLCGYCWETLVPLVTG